MAKRKTSKDKRENFYLVREDVLPEVFLKVIEVKRRLDSSYSTTVSEAVRDVGISRSAYYKYRTAIRDAMSFTDKPVRTLLLVTESTDRIVQRCLDVFFESGVTVLSFQQGLPMNGLVHALVTFQTDVGQDGIEALISRLSMTRGVVQIITPKS